MRRRIALGWNRWRPALRLAGRDAVRHRTRSIFSTLLVALPIAALVAGTALTTAAPPARDTALASIPAGAQAVVTATAVTRTGAPFQQLPEGAPGPWVDDIEQVPANEAELGERLPAANELLPYWDSPQLLATTGIELAPGQVSGAGLDVGALDDLDLATVVTATLQEAGEPALGLLLPDLTRGVQPTTAGDAVITSGLAALLGIDLQDTFTMVAPPFNGWYGIDGRIGQVIQDSQRAFRVSGIVTEDGARAWSLDGWMSAMATTDPAGVDGHWLVVGTEPVTWQHARQLNLLQAFAVSRHVLTNYPSASELYPVAIDQDAVLLRVVSLLLTAAGGALLVFFLVTPAFAVAIDQSRRGLGLASANGATPADLRRIVATQGLVVGVAGGVLGAGVGTILALATAPILLPGLDLLSVMPWWIIAAGVGIAAVIGLVATHVPARQAARLQPVDALKDRPTPSRPTPSRGRAIARAAAGSIVAPVALLVAAMSLGALSLSAARPAEGYRAPGTLPATATAPVVLLVLSIVAAVAGLLMAAGWLTGLGARLAGGAPVVVRLALRDAADHRSRFLPAAIAVLVAVGAASYGIVLAGSGTANQRDRTGEMVSGGGLVIGARVPVSADFDRLVIADAASAMAADLPVTAVEPISAAPWEAGTQLTQLLPAGSSCPTGSFPDVASGVDPDAPLRCTSWEHAHSPSMSLAWWGSSETYVLTGDALRASGLPGSAAAAEMLDGGGVVVNNAAYLSDEGTVRIGVSDELIRDEADVDRIVEMPGVFLRGFAPPLTVAPDSAAGLGVKHLEYLGGYVITDPELTPAQSARARALIEQHTTLAWVGEPALPHPWGRSVSLLPIVALAALAVAATALSLVLARTQSRRDAVTMHALGATPSFLRRFALTQAGVVLVAGVPLGLAAGIALGSYQVAWNRRMALDGAWLETIPLWGLQSGLAGTVVAAGLLTALAVSRAPGTLARRAID